MRQAVLAAQIALILAASSARASSVTPEMDRVLREGLDAVYRMDFDAADAAVQKGIALQPDYPHPYLGAVATDFVRYTFGSEEFDSELARRFQKKADRAIAVSESWLKTHPKDADVLLVLGTSYGIAARLALERREWLHGWRDGSRAMKYVRASLKADPQIYDSYLGLGMFDYYADTIPRFAGWLAKIMFGGNRARGLKELELAAEKGRYGVTAAKLILVQIFTEDAFGARNPPEAARLMREIRAQYPDSAMMHSAEITTLYENKEMDAALAEAREYLARVQNGKYPALDLSGAHVRLGTALWGMGQKEEALAEFRAAVEGKGKHSHWTAWAFTREGQLLDALGRRDEALTAYRAAYADPDNADCRAIIKSCLAKPCVGPQYPGHFGPY